MRLLLPTFGSLLGGGALVWLDVLIRFLPYLGVGSLLLLIGYFAPAPPCRPQEAP
jgi:uncharacterized membrane protein